MGGKISMLFKFKKAMHYMIPVMVVLAFCFGTVNATTSYSNWSGKVGYNWIGVGSQKKETDSRLLNISWTNAESNYLKIYMRILNEDLNETHRWTMEYLETGRSFNVPAVKGKVYILQASRFYMWDPSVYCSGTWKIN